MFTTHIKIGHIYTFLQKKKKKKKGSFYSHVNKDVFNYNSGKVNKSCLTVSTIYDEVNIRVM